MLMPTKSDFSWPPPTNAASVAAMFLTTETAVTEIPKKESDMPMGGMGGGMPGMGGMGMM